MVGSSPWSRRSTPVRAGCHLKNSVRAQWRPDFDLQRPRQHRQEDPGQPADPGRPAVSDRHHRCVVRACPQPVRRSGHLLGLSEVGCCSLCANRAVVISIGAGGCCSCISTPCSPRTAALAGRPRGALIGAIGLGLRLIRPVCCHLFSSNKPPRSSSGDRLILVLNLFAQVDLVRIGLDRHGHPGGGGRTRGSAFRRCPAGADQA